MPRLTPPKVVLFDWHGTLVDTFAAMYLAVDDVLRALDALGLSGRLVRPGRWPAPEHEELLSGVRARRELPLALKQRRLVSRTEIFELMFDDDEAAKRMAHEAFDRRYLAHFGQVRPFERGARAMLTTLRGAGLATGLLTNRRRALLMHELTLIDGSGWRDLFDVVVCGDDVAQRKPSPDMVLRALAQLRRRPGADVWFVGDASTDTVAAKRAGVTAAYYNGARWEPARLLAMFPEAWRPDLVAADFAALQALALPLRRGEGRIS
jgi:phosphoglycolate phosphatase